jgi:hypothetical protein
VKPVGERQRPRRVMWTRCPEMSCRADVVVSLDSDRAKCKRCGKEWPWKKTGLIHGTRGA